LPLFPSSVWPTLLGTTTSYWPAYIPLSFLAFPIAVFCTVFSCVLKIMEMGSSITLVSFYRTTWCHIPEDNLHIHPYENRKS
jgi:hypothetical protein